MKAVRKPLVVASPARRISRGMKQDIILAFSATGKAVIESSVE
jgi:hypothetical protein